MSDEEADDVEYEIERTLGRDEAAALLGKLADDVASGSVAFYGGGVVADVPEGVELEIEYEREDDEAEIEIELEWPVEGDEAIADGESSDEATADEEKETEGNEEEADEEHGEGEA
jgi:amphi-Trp domain-containing protein